MKSIASIISDLQGSRTSTLRRAPFDSLGDVLDLDAHLRNAFAAEICANGSTLMNAKAAEKHIHAVAEWLADTSGRCGLMLYGGLGSGKTTLACAVRRMAWDAVQRADEILEKMSWKLDDAEKRQLARQAQIVSPEMKRAADIATLYRTDDTYAMETISRLETCGMLIIDDLGTEPQEVMCYGSPRHPFAELLDARYAARRLTMVTTNLDTKDIESRYGARTADRCREYFATELFTEKSYRK